MRMPAAKKAKHHRQAENTAPQHNIIEAMLTEVATRTKRDIEGEILCLEAMYPNSTTGYENPLMAFKANTDPDTMYHREAMRELDKEEFIKAMQKEADDQAKNGNFTIIPKSEVPKGATLLPAVWQMRQKRDIRTRAIKKYKAQLNIDGSGTRHGVHYYQTYAPVTSWNAIRLLQVREDCT